MKAVKEKEQLQKTVDSWKNSSQNHWKLVDSGMTSNSKVGLGYEIQSNNEVLSYEEEMNRTVFKCTEEDFLNKPLYSRFSKTDNFKGVPHPLTGDYTPKPQEEIDNSLYVFGKKGPQKPETSILDDKFSENSVTSSEEVVSEPKPKEAEPSLQLNTVRQNVNSVRPNVNTGRGNVNSVKSNVNSVRHNVNSVRTNVNTGRSKQLVPTSNSNSFSLIRPQGNWGTAVKTSAGYNWRRTRPNSNYNSRSNFVRTDHPLKNMEDRDSVMLDSDESGITYTEVSSPFEGLSDMGSSRADDHEYLELPGMPEDPYVEAALQALPSPDYVPGPEEPEQAPPLPDYVPVPENTDDEIVAEDQPGVEDASPTAQSLDYVLESYPEADPEEDDDEDPKEDPVDYSANGGYDGDDEDESSKEDEDDVVDMETDEDEEEEEHPAPADSVVVALPATDQAPSVEETESFETDESAATPPPHPAYRVTTRISILAPVPTPAWSDAEIPSPSLPLSPPSPVLSPAPPPSPIRSLGYQAAMIRIRAEAASTSHSLPLPPPFILSPTRSDAPSSGIPPPLPISVPTSSPPLLLPSASRREDRPKVTLPPRKRLGIALGPRYEVGESSSAAAAKPVGGLRADYGFVATIDREIRHDPEREVGYEITDLWDEIVETLQVAPVSTDTELGRHMTAFETRVRQDTDDIYTRLDDEQSQRHLLAGRLNMLFGDRRAHAYTRHQMETEARLS
ncbi:hypothetical protein Tco_1335376 [Tanacetum coccineum]